MALNPFEQLRLLAPEPRAAFEEIVGILLKDTAKVTDRLKSISETLESTHTKEALARKAN
jgi:hypothetical protein